MKLANPKLLAASGVLPKAAAEKRPKSDSRRPAAKSKVASNKKADVLSGTKLTKQDRIISLLQRPAGATLDTMIKETDWQKHSLRAWHEPVSAFNHFPRDQCPSRFLTK